MCCQRLHFIDLTGHQGGDEAGAKADGMFVMDKMSKKAVYSLGDTHHFTMAFL